MEVHCSVWICVIYVAAYRSGGPWGDGGRKASKLELVSSKLSCGRGKKSLAINKFSSERVVEWKG